MRGGTQSCLTFYQFQCCIELGIMPHPEPKQFDDDDEPSSLTREAVDALMAIDALSEGLKEIETRFLADAVERRKKLKAKLEAIKSNQISEG